MALAPYMGSNIRRREDPRLITGAGTYVDDVALPGTAWMAVLRSPFAHARVTRLDLAAALAHPGVLAAVSGRDVAALMSDTPEDSGSDQEPAGEEGGGERPPLASQIVRFAGEGVAAVVAVDDYVAADALELIEVEYEPLEAYVDPEARPATSPGFAEAKADPLGRPVGTEREFSTGDIDGGFRDADVVVSEHIVNQRVAPLPLETRGVLADYHPGTEELLIHNSTQCAQFVRDAVAEALNLASSRVRVIVKDVGGGFGCKIGKYPEDVLAAYFAVKLRRPVKWIESRSDNFLTTVHGRSETAQIKVAAKADGTITALHLDLLADTGAYDAGWLPRTTAGMITGCYDIRNLSSASRTVMTNKTPLGAYRGAGRPEAAFFIERAMDLVARELQLDPAEVRRKNFVPPDAFPYHAADWPVFDSGRYQETMETALERADYRHLIEQRDRARDVGRLAGVGVASYVEVTGFGWETSTITLESDGSATVYTGISPHGQGQETTFAQIVADECGVDPEQIRVLYGDTAMGYGQGTMGSRGTSVGGTAVRRAAVEIREKMAEIVSDKLEVAVEDLELVDGRWQVKGYPDRFETVGDIASLACSGNDLPEGMEPGLRATANFSPDEVTAPFGTHVAAVEIDPETGRVEIVRFLTVDDCGTIISPRLVEGQVHGGVLQGISQALFEEVRYAEDGQLLTGSFPSYGFPTIGEAAAIEVTHTETPSLRNELGVKGVGEAGSIGSTPAVANAVIDALAPLGIRHLDMPFTPERVWQAIRAAMEQRTSAA